MFWRWLMRRSRLDQKPDYEWMKSYSSAHIMGYGERIPYKELYAYARGSSFSELTTGQMIGA